MKILTPRLHSIIDYLVVIFLLFAPTLFGLTYTILTFTYTLAMVHLMLTVFTDFEYGLVKVIPLRIHGLIELLVAVALVASPLILNRYTDRSMDRYFFCAFGVAVLLTWTITDYSDSKKKQDGENE